MSDGMLIILFCSIPVVIIAITACIDLYHEYRADQSENLVTTIHHPGCSYRPDRPLNVPGQLSWNDLNYEWCKAVCHHVNVDAEILEARTHIVKI